MGALEKAFEAAAANPPRVVMPEMDDERTRAASERLASEGLAEPVPLADADDALAHVLVEARGVKPALAARMVGKPLIRAAAMVADGQADLMVAGAIAPTRRVIEAASLAIGLGHGVSAPSSFFLMVFPDGRELIFADCAVNVAPDADTLAGIAAASEASAKALLGAARVALLSYSTGTSGTGPSVETVRAAAEALRSGGLAVDGPVQGDAALNPAVAASKGAGAGDANVLIFPDLDAGNIAYKLAQELGRAQAIGPFLQGFRRPVCDLSRGATVEDIVAATVVSAMLRA
jgi:phosphate acetyltransferase